ncbi:MAG: carboxypeptidase-like regulatory domain-containing protein, partial [Thermoplasmata archaeon]|nr:carboxypeptidase-like regulatory domain-containing protein [Thermoplasmata archaeon]
SGGPAPLYNASAYDVLTVYSPSLASGSLSVNGVAVAFRGGEAKLALSPGEYSLALYNGSVLVGATDATLTSGSPVAITLPFPRYPVEFHESGLSPGTPWGVRFGLLSSTSTTAWLNLSAENGSYNYTIDPVGGYLAPRHLGPLGVLGGPVAIDLFFWTFNYTVRFEASNLPSGTPWSVTLDSATASVPGLNQSFLRPNGTYQYTVDVANTYEAQPANGTVTVEAGSPLVSVSFSLRPAWATGVVRPINASVLINGQPVAVTNGAFNLSELPGNYELEGQATGYTPEFTNVTLTPGNTSFFSFVLNPLPLKSHTNPSHPGGGSSSGPPYLQIAAGAAALLAVGVAGALVLYRRRTPRR